MNYGVIVLLELHGVEVAFKILRYTGDISKFDGAYLVNELRILRHVKHLFGIARTRHI